MTLSELAATTLPTIDEDDSLPAKLLRLAKLRHAEADNHAAEVLIEAAQAIAEYSCMFDFVPSAGGSPRAIVEETPMDKLNLPENIPVYECHKTVKAVKVRLYADADHNVVAQPIEEFSVDHTDLPHIVLPKEWVKNRVGLPPAGPDAVNAVVATWAQEYEGILGYIVQYDGGYTSWSPVEAFEMGHHGPMATAADLLGQRGKQLDTPDGKRPKGDTSLVFEELVTVAEFPDLGPAGVAWRLLVDERGWLWRVDRGGRIARIIVDGLAPPINA